MELPEWTRQHIRDVLELFDVLHHFDDVLFVIKTADANDDVLFDALVDCLMELGEDEDDAELITHDIQEVI